MKNGIQDYLKRHGALIDDIVIGQLQENLGEARLVGPITDEMIRRYMEFSRGGKRLRGNFVRLGFLAFGGQNEEVALKAGSVMEMIHSCVLIHDDIMDQDPIRRNKPTIHEQFREFYLANVDGGTGEREARHFGESMAINIGDTGVFIAFEMLCTADIEPDALIAGIRMLSGFLKKTAYGQALDIYQKDVDRVTQQDILNVYYFKTSLYTITGPMQMGALLAGADLDSVAPIENYGKPAGIAFQLRDDLLGLFGDEETFGKPIGSDLREGKMTLPVLKAYEFGDESQRRTIRGILGREDVSLREVEIMRSIVTETRAIEYCNSLARDCVGEAISAIPEFIDPESEVGVRMRDIAEYLLSRDS